MKKAISFIKGYRRVMGDESLIKNFALNRYPGGNKGALEKISRWVSEDNAKRSPFDRCLDCLIDLNNSGKEGRKILHRTLSEIAYMFGYELIDRGASTPDQDLPGEKIQDFHKLTDLQRAMDNGDSEEVSKEFHEVIRELNETYTKYKEVNGID